jgi:Pyruvate/2-oxoacid:ferredoxin oxidoreductase delta subunit
MTEKTLYHQLAEHIGHGHSRYIPEIFQLLADEDEARLLLAARKPITSAQLVETLGCDPAAIEKMLDDLFFKGLIYKSKKPDGLKYYCVRHVIQFHDATIVVPDPSPAMLDLWKRYDEEEWPDYIQELSGLFPAPPSRIIPINESLTPEMQVLHFEDINRVLDNARSLAVTRCSCRVVHGECGHPIDVCLQIDKAADYAVERGTGRPVDREEAMSMLKMCGDRGLVHVAMNTRAVGTVICSCCEDCCENWAGGQKFVSPSRFQAIVEAELCSLCEDCLDRCFFGAITMTGPDDTALVDAEQCMGCGVCCTGCPEEAIGMTVVRPEAHIPA